VIVGDSYEVVIKNKNIYITGDLNLNVDGNMNTKIAKNYTLDVGEEMKVTVGGSQTNTIGGSQTITVGGDQTMSITGIQDITATAGTKINNNVDVTGTLTATVDVKAGGKLISLVDHKHRDSAGVKPGITTKPI
jgi:type VI secretion system secreted protein VgrG